MTFRAKLMACILTLVAVSVCLGSNLLMYISFSSAMQRAQENAVAAYELTRYTVASAGTAADPAGMVEVLRHIQTPNGTVLRLRRGGEELFSTGAPDWFDDSLADSCSETVLAIKTASATGERAVQITGALPGGELVLDGLYRTGDIYDTLHDQQRLYRSVFVGTMFLATVLAAVLMHWLTRPLEALSRASCRIAGGELGFRADASGGDEFARVAADFNRMADELGDRIEELRQAAERQEVFTGAFAHEMKTPMTAIIGYADMLRSRDLGDEDRRTAANYIFTEGRRLEQLSRKLLELLVLRRRDFPLKPCDLAALIREIDGELAFYREQYGVTLRASWQEGQRDAERDLLKTLILNLIDNARKAMPGGGEIVLTQTLTEGGFTVSVLDHGYGMAAGELERITEAFYRVDKSRSRAQGGAGLGLAICREIARLHDGTLTFASTPGLGTLVTLTVGGESA